MQRHRMETQVRRQSHVILASASPRRQQLLVAMGLDFTIMPMDTDESLRDGEGPEQVVRRLSMAKALAARDALSASRDVGRWGDQAVSESCVIAADTIVVAPDGHTILGKPESPQHARAMLGQLRNKRHEVYSGVALVDVAQGHRYVVAVCTAVYMRAFDQAEIDRYVASGDPMDKAGAYAIQHAHFAPIARIEGCYANVMGLPMCHLYRALTSGWPQCAAGANDRSSGPSVRHPLDSCPYALEHVGCPWAEPILSQVASLAAGGEG
jgi:septum formation protein